MAHQFVREPLRAEEADRLANACRSLEEKLIVWTLLDTGLRVSELCSLTLDNVQWQQRALRVTGKAGPSRHAEQATDRPAVRTGPRHPGTVLRPERRLVRRDASGPEDRQTGREPRPAHPGGHPARAPPYLGDAGTPEGDVPGGRGRPRIPALELDQPTRLAGIVPKRKMST